MFWVFVWLQRIPKPFNLCLFEEIPVLHSHQQVQYTTPYTMYSLYNNNRTSNPHAQGNIDAPCRNNTCLSFSKNGSQKLRKNIKCRRHYMFLTKKQTDTPCEEYHKKFCRDMSKLYYKHHSHMPTEIIQHCKLTKS